MRSIDQIISEASEAVAAAAREIAAEWSAAAEAQGGQISSRSAHVLAISRILYAAEVKLGIVEDFTSGALE